MSKGKRGSGGSSGNRSRRCLGVKMASGGLKNLSVLIILVNCTLSYNT